jgi:hypothetical protein
MLSCGVPSTATGVRERLLRLEMVKITMAHLNHADYFRKIVWPCVR